MNFYYCRSQFFDEDDFMFYKDDLISTIVNISGLWAKFLSYHIRDKFGKTVIKDLMAETLVSVFSLPPWINSVKKSTDNSYC